MEQLNPLVNSDDALSGEEDLFLKEVIQDDHELYFLHHYLSEIFQKGEE